MLKKAAGRYASMRRELETDTEYRALSQRLAELEPQFRAAVELLPEEHRDTITEFIGIYGEMAERETEIACWLP